MSKGSTMKTVLRCLAAVAVLAALPAVAQTPVQGTWDGAIQVAGQTLPIHVRFAGPDKATIDIQGASGLPLINVKAAGDAVHFELQAGLGLCVFEGTLKDGVIAG